MATNEESLKELDILEDFQWDDSVDFFGEQHTIKEPEKEKEEEKEETSENSKSTKEEENIEFEFDFEEDTEKEGDFEKESKKTVKSVSSDNQSIPHKFVDFLVKQGIVELDEEDMKEFNELDDIDKEEVVKDFYLKAVEDKFEQDIKELPEIVKNSLKIAIKGGNVNDYLSRIYNNRSAELTMNMDIEDDIIQERIVRQKLKDEDYDEDYIDSQIEYLKDSDRLKITADKYYSNWKKLKQKEEQDYLKSVEEANKARRESQIEYRKSLFNQLSEADNIRGFKINKKEITELPEYVAIPNIKTENGQQITGFQKDLFEAMKDKEKVILMAKLLRNNFDFSSLERTIKTEQTRSFKDNIQRQKTNKEIISTNKGSSQKTKRLVDFFDE